MTMTKIVNLQALMEKAWSQNDIHERPVVKPTIYVIGEEERKATTPDYYFRDSRLILYVGREDSVAIRLLKEQGIGILTFPSPRNKAEALRVVEETLNALGGETS